jgi:hypothetical protein
VCIAVFASFLLYNSGYYLPYGGYVPGPRFLTATLPFLAVGLAAAFAEWPVTTTLLAAFSVGAMTVATAAEPLIGSDDTRSWLARWRHDDFTHSVISGFGVGHGWLAVAPFLVAVVVAALVAAPRLEFRAAALVPLAAAALVWLAAPDLLHTDRAVGQSTGLIALIAMLAALLAVVAVHDRLALLAGAPLLALALPRFAAHTKESLAAAALSLAAAAVAAMVRRRALTVG